MELSLWKVAVLSSLLSIATIESVSASEIYPFFRGIREEGMGGAGINVVDDETALFINPAGLGKIRGPYFTPLNIQGETNTLTQSEMSSNTGDINFTNPQTVLALAQISPNNHIHAEAQTLPAFVTTNFGMGLYGKYQADGQLNSATNIFHLDYFNDYGAVVGYCFRLFSGRLKIGVSGKIIDRTYVNSDLPGNSTNLSLSNIAKEGVGAGLDTSVMLSAPWVWLPSITGVVHDVGGTNFTLSNGVFYHPGLNPPPQEQSIDTGFGLFPIFTNHIRGTITAEYHDVMNYISAAPMRQFHAGGEINFNDVFFMRGGVNETYWTAGVEFVFGHNQLQFASYGEEIGTLPYNVEDRRYVLQYAFRF